VNNQSSCKTYLEAIRETIAEEMENDQDVVFFGEDIAAYGGAFGLSWGLLNRFGPDRIVNTPISENSFVGLATGAALTGLKPIVEIMFMDFIALAMDQIVNHLAKLRYIYGGQVSLPVVIRTPSGAGRRYGASHSQSLEAWFMHVPGLKIAVPSNPHDARWLLRTAIHDSNPWLFVESKKLYSVKGEVGQDMQIPIGHANIIHHGSDCTVVTYSRMTQECLNIIEPMRQKGIHLEMIDLRTLCPLDIVTIRDSVKETGCAVVVEEDCRTCGVGAEISARIMEECFSFLSKPVLRIACPDSPIPASSKLEDFLIPGSESIKKQIEQYLGI
jgi:pyruvate/2-oxoglutarate/acetoin dehydrogenase E1 component